MESQCIQHYLLVHELVVLTWNLSTTSIVEAVTVLIRQPPQLSIMGTATGSSCTHPIQNDSVLSSHCSVYSVQTYWFHG